jgi:C-terminal processing protease CtpA/Prc
MVALVATYLFDGEPVHLNDLQYRRGDRTQQYWTLPFVPGRRFGRSKPVYVLTSAETFSGAEEFTYDLKTQKRAVIVGETTGGGANPGDEHRVAEHFTIFVPDGRAINPITKTNWEGTGIKPDVETPPEDALITAHILAIEQRIAATTDPDRARLRATLERLKKKREAAPTAPR